MRAWVVVVCAAGCGLSGCARDPARTAPEVGTAALQPAVTKEPEVPTGGSFRDETLMVGDREYRYALWVPSGIEMPSAGLVFLHGLGECGTDGRKQVTVGIGPALERDPDRWPFVVVLPQKPEFVDAWEDHAGAVLAMLDAAIEAGLIDAKRVAITGLSQGGHGTIAIGAAHRERFRAAVPVCGYVAPVWGPGGVRSWTQADDPALTRYASVLAEMPMWVVHGARDQVVPMRESELLVEVLIGAGSTPRFTVLPEANHNAWDATYGDAEIAAWLVEMTR